MKEIPKRKGLRRAIVTLSGAVSYDTYRVMGQNSGISFTDWLKMFDTMVYFHAFVSHPAGPLVLVEHEDGKVFSYRFEDFRKFVDIPEQEE